MVRFIGTEIYRRDLQLSRRIKRHPSKTRTVRRERLKSRSEIEVSSLGRVLARVCGIYSQIGRWIGATWSKEQGKINGFEL